jgi:hypothetical protein
MKQNNPPDKPNFTCAMPNRPVGFRIKKSAVPADAKRKACKTRRVVLFGQVSKVLKMAFNSIKRPFWV